LAIPQLEICWEICYIFKGVQTEITQYWFSAVVAIVLSFARAAGDPRLVRTLETYVISFTFRVHVAVSFTKIQLMTCWEFLAPTALHNRLQDWQIGVLFVKTVISVLLTQPRTTRDKGVTMSVKTLQSMLALSVLVTVSLTLL
jgi:hypothetical protein